jgi:hypothetical protein
MTHPTTKSSPSTSQLIDPAHAACRPAGANAPEATRTSRHGQTPRLVRSRIPPANPAEAVTGPRLPPATPGCRRRPQ